MKQNTYICRGTALDTGLLHSQASLHLHVAHVLQQPVTTDGGHVLSFNLGLEEVEFLRGAAQGVDLHHAAGEEGAIVDVLVDVL